MERFTLPEVHRAALEGSLLQVLALGLELHRFQLPEAPRAPAVHAALTRLLLMRAVVAIDWRKLQLPPPERGAILVEDVDSKGSGYMASFGTDTALLKDLGALAKLQ